jgi:hypothetical protein
MRFGLKGNAKAKAKAFAIGCNYWIGPLFGGDLIVWHNYMGDIWTDASGFEHTPQTTPDLTGKRSSRVDSTSMSNK